LSACRDNTIDECGLDLCFATDFEVLGKLTQHELKPGGASIAVTDENKEEYLRYAMTRSTGVELIRLSASQLLPLHSPTVHQLSNSNLFKNLKYCSYYCEIEPQLSFPLCSFENLSTIIWNSVPGHIRDCISIESIKRNLKKSKRTCSD